jgi:hypothetical protein
MLEAVQVPACRALVAVRQGVDDDPGRNLEVLAGEVGLAVACRLSRVPVPVRDADRQVREVSH